MFCEAPRLRGRSDLSVGEVLHAQADVRGGGAFLGMISAPRRRLLGCWLLLGFQQRGAPPRWHLAAKATCKSMSEHVTALFSHASVFWGQSYL